MWPHPVASLSQQNAKKRKLEDGGGEDMGEYKIRPLMFVYECCHDFIRSHLRSKFCFSCTSGQIARHPRHSVISNSILRSLFPVSPSDWHQGVCHAWRDDEEQR